jgi:hypothetical protein
MREDVIANLPLYVGEVGRPLWGDRVRGPYQEWRRPSPALRFAAVDLSHGER